MEEAQRPVIACNLDALSAAERKRRAELAQAIVPQARSTQELADGYALQLPVTAPLAHEGLINCSPKGMDTFRILGPLEVAYLDLTGSGIETVANARENGRILFMFCAFEGPPKIVRLHGTGDVHVPGSPQYDSLSSLFPAYVGGRAIKSCNVLAAQLMGAEVTTIEGITPADGLHPMQAAFKACHGLQCGFCTPGMVMSAIDLVQHHPHATEREIREGLEGNVCRCTGYHNIVKAVAQGAAAMQ